MQSETLHTKQNEASEKREEKCFAFVTLTSHACLSIST
jgi:hypothetical protein